MTQAIIAPSVSLVNGRPATTSLKIAEHFGKRHASVLRDIRNTICKCPEKFNVHNFVLVKYTDAKGEEHDAYDVFQDGFVILVMGYTGTKAMEIKLAYIAAFNAMREKLEATRQPAALPPSELPPSFRSELKSLVDAKLSTYPASIQGKARSEIWTRFNRHFRIAEYAQLHSERLTFS